jgi:nucleoside-diphosphate-sugar epimerase
MRDGSARTNERFLVTGSLGCIGVWVLRELLAEGAVVVGSDLATDSPRLGLVLDDEHDARLVRAKIDVTDMTQIERALDEHEITRIIHLAALQVPFCRSDPPLGAAVNVVGTVNVLEAARRRQDRIPHVVYASSIAVLDSADGQPGEALEALPGTVYGVYKRADEQLAMRYWLDYGLPSIGLRPHTVFGPARDQGLTSAPTMAMLAAAAGRAYTIPYGGGAQFQYAPDVADAFVSAALADVKDASVHNLGGAARSIADVIETIVSAAPEADGLISYQGAPLSFPATVDSDGLDGAIGQLRETPFATAVEETIVRFRSALADRRLDPAILG